MQVKFKKLDKKAVIPFRAKEGDAGLDLTVTKVVRNNLFKVTYEFGLAVELPKFTVGDIRPRSSVHKSYSILSNSPGTIDSGYRGPIKAVFYVLPFISTIFRIGERAAQLVIHEIPDIETVEALELSDSDRGTGGYGSTGK